MFKGFHEGHVDVGETELYVRHGGAGHPVLLLHGHPRTHATWHKVAPVLEENHSQAPEEQVSALQEFHAHLPGRARGEKVQEAHRGVIGPA
jgi:pimeloyl-ACP methyl ester carboxylesterase